MKKRILLNISCILALTLIGACGSTGKTKEALAIEDTRTVLDVHQAKVSQVEQRLLIGGFQGQLSNDEIANLKLFADDYARTGRGNIAISYPSGGIVEGTTDSLIRATQRQLYVSGVEFKNMSFGSYVPNGQNNPIVLSFVRSQVADVECTPWSQLKPTKVGGNQSSPRFGCAKAANLAAMIVDPGDLKGDRKEDKSDAYRGQKAIQDYRDGKVEQVSGSISGGSH